MKRSRGYITTNSTDLNGRVVFKVNYDVNGVQYFSTPSSIESRSPVMANGTVNSLDTQLSLITSSDNGLKRGLCQDGYGNIGIDVYDTNKTRCLPQATFHNGGTSISEDLATFNNGITMNAGPLINNNNGGVELNGAANYLKINGLYAIRYDASWGGPKYGGSGGFGYVTSEADIAHRFVLNTPTSNTLVDGTTLRIAFNSGTGSVTGSTFFTPGGYTVTSDRRMKKNIVTTPYIESTTRLDSLVVRTYEYNDLYKSFSKDVHVNNTQTGFIAQEMEDIYPNAIYPADFGGNIYLSIDKNSIIPDIVVGYQSLKANYTTLKLQHDDLKLKYDDLSTKFNALLTALNITLH